MQSGLKKRYILKPNDTFKYEFLKLCFLVYLDNPIEKAYEIIKDSGYRTRTGTPHSQANIYIKAKEFVLEYPDEARSEYIKRGFYTDDKEWYDLQIFIAVRRYKGKDEFIKWAVKQKLYKKAFKIFKDHFRLSDEDYHAFDDILGDD